MYKPILNSITCRFAGEQVYCFPKSVPKCKMSTHTLYRRYLEIIQHWPLDPNKLSRDLGVHIRARIGKHFPKGELSPIDSTSIPTLRDELNALERLTKNVNRDSHRYKECSTVSGMTAEQLARVTSTETIQSMNEFYDSGIVNTLKYRFFSMFKK
ncbi:putative methyltransferase-like protein 15 [Dermatophagoides farinae]|uniref:Mitochondrial nucleoid factor 1 n=2 Tax=Dermatophagoides farinae TaxID=6954 RepID=A0A922HX44_DERFA|nr:hypothetical protein HUG17_1531 [Dermatophagoides farinae]KAH9516294.1 putative methyltransferase-like protein 15 [Dermatophagoides farinae]